MTNPIYAWALSFITTVSPVGQVQYGKDAKESITDGQARRESIAQDVVDIVYADPAPPLFLGPYGKGRTVAVVLAIMEHEGSFRRDVDYGIGPLSRGDGGKSWCLMQILIDNNKGQTSAWNTKLHRFAFPGDPPSDVVHGWTGKELVGDRKKCVTAGLRMVRSSFKGTSSLPILERLRIYASGKATAGSIASQKRMGTAINWYAAHPAPLMDVDAIDLLLAPPPAVETSPNDVTVSFRRVLFPKVPRHLEDRDPWSKPSVSSIADL